MKNILRQYTRTFYFNVACALLIFGAAQAAQADPVTFRVNVTINSSPSTAGFLDLQFNPGNISSPAATATVTNFTAANSTLRSGEVERQGAVTGELPGTVEFGNSGQINDLFQGFTFATGSSFGFDLTLNQPGTGSGFGSDFLLFLFGADGQTPLFSTNDDGRLLTITLNTDGSTVVQTFGNTTITIAVTPQAVPEPATLLLLATGLSGAAAMRRRKKASAQS